MPGEPTLAEWRLFLTEQMDVLDDIWEEELDPLWMHAQGRLAKLIGEQADKFYQSYWEMFRSVLKNSGKDWNQAKRDAALAITAAREHVATTWAQVALTAIDRAERDLGDARAKRASTLEGKQQFRAATECKTQGDKFANRDDYGAAIKKYREALVHATNADDMIEESIRQNTLDERSQIHSQFNRRINYGRLIVQILALLVAAGVGGLGAYKYLGPGVADTAAVTNPPKEKTPG